MQSEIGKKVRMALVIIALIVIAVLFPVRKEVTTDFYAKDGSKVGSLKENLMRPWWMPKSALTEEKPLSEADKETVRKLIAAAEARGGYKTAEKIKREAGLAPSSSKVSGDSGGTSSGGTNGNESKPSGNPSGNDSGSTSGSGATIESKIPAVITGYKLFTEQRSTLSWLGVFKSETDKNIQNLDVSIELIGKEAASKQVEEFKKTYGKKISEVRVEGLKAYRVRASEKEVKLAFVDGDFYYELDLLVKENADNYLDAIVKAAESARI